jgi:hypothetical protein
MIGSSLPLCYPQIGSAHLLYPRVHLPCLPLDKTYPTWGTHRVFEQFVWLEVDSVKVALSRPTQPPVTQAVRHLNYNQSASNMINQSATKTR